MNTPQAEQVREQGELVAKFTRPGFAGRPSVELRLYADECEGKRSLSLRQWEWSPRARDYAPTKKGTSIRLGEVIELVDALQKVVEVEGLQRVEKRSRATRTERSRRRSQQPDEPAPDEPAPGTLPGLEPEPADDLAEFRRNPKRGRNRG